MFLFEGHNWGSEHDPATDECSPKADSGGKYVMYTNWVSGYDPNNKLFSSCSRRSMGDVLASKSNICFKERSGKFCGNSVLEEGEQCDGGNNMKTGRDPCCDKDCTLKGAAICSDVNQPCCDQCQYASVGMICERPSTNSCKGAASCTGLSAVCPSPPAAIDGASCQDIGTCRSGACVPLCEVKGLMPCICDNLEMSCKRCCRHNTTSECIPYKTDQQLTYNMSEGMPCIQGYCDSQGVCQKQVGDLVQRMWDIENVTKTTATPDTTTATTSKASVNAASEPRVSLFFVNNQRTDVHEPSAQRRHKVYPFVIEQTYYNK
ncbi:Disintegrin and metalloproteinase domain-containing protein 17 [Lamellibrachia satsuma]|nr:Disintegrin and metalloproteinase domain-containing protein 17 [Lamellibrachia satsuma]